MTSPLVQLASFSSILCFVNGAMGDEEKKLSRLDRDKLLEYRDASGARRDVKSFEDWQKRRHEIVAAMESIMGEFPSEDRRVDLAPEVVEEVDAGSYVRQLITYQSETGSRTPAYLCIPRILLEVDTTRRIAPAVLCLHPTDAKVGHKVVVGLGGREGRQYAAELAKSGYVTIAPAYPLLANYQPDLRVLGYESGTMKAIWDNSRALDLLASLKFVDHSKGFGAIGHSLGGHNAIFTAVFDPRISVLATSCGFDSFLDYYDGVEKNWHLEKGWCQTRYMPRLAEYRGRLKEIPFDFHELLGALAPRRVFVSAPLHDSNFRSRSVEACVAAARAVYVLAGSGRKLTVTYPDCGHDFPQAVRALAYGAVGSVLKTPSD